VEVVKLTDPNSTIHVLSIEDDVDYERLIGAWLRQAESLQFQVTPAERLSDVARPVELEGYDCMLLDLGHSDRLGIETLISARAIAKELPIVVLTAAEDYDVAERSMRSGADDFLVKGNFGPDVLVETIVAAVDGRRAGLELPGALGGRMVPLRSSLPVSAQIAADTSDQLACSGSWNRYRRASGVQF
jgi:DNA-binding response OmpR family regulator